MVERDIKKLLRRPTTRLRVTELKSYVLAWVDYNGREVEVVLDPMRGGLIESVVHELIHARYPVELAKFGKFEEPFVVVMEQGVMELVNNDEARVAWWRAAINAKLDMQEAA
jgi:hypothetical protein